MVRRQKLEEAAEGLRPGPYLRKSVGLFLAAKVTGSAHCHMASQTLLMVRLPEQDMSQLP